MNPHVVFILLLAVIALAATVVGFGIVVMSMRRALSELACELERRTQYVPLFDAPQVCRCCGADELVVIMASCTWVEDDLCSSCAGDAECDERAGERS